MLIRGRGQCFSATVPELSLGKLPNMRVLVPVRSAMAQKRSLSKITDFMTGSSRKERVERDVDCVPPPTKRSCHRGTFDPKVDRRVSVGCLCPC